MTSSINDLLSSVDGRDKVMKSVQYVARVLVAVAGDRGSMQSVAALDTQTAMARKYFRFLKQLNNLSALMKMGSLERALAAPATTAKNLGFFFYFSTDHVLWLRWAGIIRSMDADSAQRWKKVSGLAWMVAAAGAAAEAYQRLQSLARRRRALLEARGDDGDDNDNDNDKEKGDLRSIDRETMLTRLSLLAALGDFQVASTVASVNTNRYTSNKTLTALAGCVSALAGLYVYYQQKVAVAHEKKD